MFRLTKVDVSEETGTEVTPYPAMFVNYSRSIKDGVAAGEYDYQHPDILDAHFPPEDERGVKHVQPSLYRFKKGIRTLDLHMQVAKRGVRHATIREQLTFGHCHPNLQRDFPIAALGSFWMDKDRNPRVVSLTHEGKQRRIYLTYGDGNWNGEFRILVVKGNQWIHMPPRLF